MPTFFVDYENGNDTWGGTSFAPLASGLNGAISSVVSSYATFSSASANFLNNNIVAPSKNIAWYSNSMAVHSVAGSNNGVALTTEGPLPPIGVDATVYRITETTANSQHQVSAGNPLTPTYAGTQYTMSVYIKSNGRNKIVLRYDADTKIARYNLTGAGTVEAVGGASSASISALDNGWYRLSLTITTTAGAGYQPDNWQILMVDSNYTGLTLASATYIGDNFSGIYLCGLQIEASASVTSYEKPPEQILSIFNGSSFVSFHVAERINSTSLRINQIAGFTAPSIQSSREFYIGGRLKTLSSTGVNSSRLNPGDTIRVMASPDPTSIGIATWTSSVTQNTRNITSSTNATPININSSAHGYVTGDTVVINSHTINTNANGTWIITRVDANNFTLNGSTGNGAGGATGNVRLINNAVVTLASSPILNIASHGNRGQGRTAWINVDGTNNSTSLLTTDYKEGDCSDSIAIGAGFTTGRVAYRSTGTLNLSGYQQISFWIKQTAGTVAVNGDISLRLCTDTLGVTSVHTVSIPSLVVLNRWTVFTVNLATNLNSSIQSIALYVDTDRGAQTFLLSNIIASKASSSNDSLSLTSLIGKNIGNEPWCSIQSINGTRIILDEETNRLPGASRGYYGTTETVNTFKRETIKTPLANSTTQQASLLTVQDQATSVGPITYIGGWNRTDMSTLTAHTFFDGSNGFGYGLSNSSLNYNTIRNFGFVRYNSGLVCNVNLYYIVSDIYAISNTSDGLLITGGTSISSFTNLNFIGNVYGINLSSHSGKNTISNVYSYSNSHSGIFVNGASNNSIFNTFVYNNSFGHTFTGSAINNFIKNCIYYFNVYSITLQIGASNNLFSNCSTFNITGNVCFFSVSADSNTFINFVSRESSFGAPSQAFTNGKMYFQNFNNTANNHLITTDGGTIFSIAAIRYSNSGIAWAMAPTSANRSSSYPLDFKVATVAVNANSLVTVRAWMRRNNIGLTNGLRIKGGIIAGVTNDITSYMTAAADIWEQVTLTFTPTESGTIDIWAECWGGTTFTAYVDDISITQV